MRSATLRKALFGGTLFAAGIAHADSTFEYVVGPLAAYARNASAVVNGVGYSASDDGQPLFFGVFGTQYCPGSGPYSYTSYVSISFIQADPDSMECEAYSYFCGRVTSDVRAYFMVQSPSELELSWRTVNAYEGITAGVWQVDALGTAALVGGPGAGAVTGFEGESEVFVLGAGLYYFESSVAAEGFGFAGASLQLLGDACACDLDGSGALNLDDIDAFASAFLSGDLAADLDGSGDLNLDDIDAFAACFLAGCG